MTTAEDDERQRAAMAAKRLIVPLQAAIESIRGQQRKKNRDLTEEQFEDGFRKSLNLALMFVYVGLSLDLELEPEQILSNTQNIIALIQQTRRR
jgi:hypothetical protein